VKLPGVLQRVRRWLQRGERPESDDAFEPEEPGSADAASEREPGAREQARSGEAAAAGASQQAAELSLAELLRARGTRSERALLDAVVEARQEGRAPAPLLIAAAQIFAQRGQPDRALALIDDLRDHAALLLAADLRAERGELAHALTLIERILVRDIDYAGARERHRRWRERLAGPRVETGAPEQPTLLIADAPQTGLRIVAEAGRGGAATVYEAVDELLGRRVALKLYHRRVSERAKLEREARIAVSLAGPGVVRVFDADPERGFIVMEWVAGGALKDRIRRADASLLLPLERWFLPLVAAVARVHASGIVHADLKPANVLFRAPEQPIVSDFGAAHRIGETSTGGSLGYMSPERLLERPLAFGDDVYALGRILEDALGSALDGTSLDAAGRRRWEGIARAALAPAGERPGNAAALLDLTRGGPG